MADNSNEREEQINGPIRDALRIREEQSFIDSLTIERDVHVNLHDVTNTYNSDRNLVLPDPAQAQAVARGSPRQI
jgi:hypothetical protein